MPNFERNLRQTCTYWKVQSTDQYGKPTFSAPTTLDCRWEEKSELFIDKKMQEVTSKAKVFLVDTPNVDESGYILLGTSAAASPLGLTDAFEIRALKRTPDLRVLKTMLVVML
jgi:hypothetical protein